MENAIDIENQVPEGVLTGIKFNVLTEDDAEKISVLSIETPAGVTDPKLGFPNPASECATCGARNTKRCEGHFGVINFPYTILHPYYISEVVQILNQICPGCKSLRRERRAKGAKGITKLDQFRGCKYCTGRYPSIRFKLSTNKKDLFWKTAIIVELNERSQNKYELENYWDFIPKDVQVEESSNPNKRVLSHAQVHHLLKDVDPSFIKEFVSRIDALFLNCFPVTPNCHRVTELVHPFSSGQKLIFDDRTRAFRKLVDFRGTANELGVRVLDCLKLSKLRLEKSSNDSALMTNIDAALNSSASKWMKEVVLTKRSDHIIRSVVTGDPNLKIYEIGIPCYIAERLQISDHLNYLNWKKLTASCNLRLLEKGEVYVRRKGDLVRVRETDELQFGDLIYRPLDDGDIMLINRPPSIHQHSMLALHVKILPIHSVVSINPLCCAPLRGDFDGDCLHGYVPQSMEARVELRELVGLDRQLRNGQSGRNLLSLSHDSLTAAHLLMAEGELMSQSQIQQLKMLCPRHLMSPAIRKTHFTKSDLWTGKQLFSMILPPEFNYISPSNGVIISKGELLLSPDGSAWLRGDADGNFFESLIDHCYGEVLDYLDAAQRVLCEWLSLRGLSVSLLDLYLCSDAHSHRNLIDEISCGLEEAEMTCHLKQLMVESSVSHLIDGDEEGKSSVSLQVEKLCYEKQKSAALTRASSNAFKYIFRDVQNLTYQFALSDNSLLAMIKSGSKGNLLKIVQQSMCLGLQHSLVPLSFRLPHKLSCAAWNDLKTQSSSMEDGIIPECTKSFIPFAVVGSSFVTGLNPLECFVHSVTSRDSTFSENADVPGTLTRKLTFFMRDIQLAYDGTVRNAYGNQVVQFSYATAKDKSTSLDGSDSDESMKANTAIGGQPVGALAACAMSEAAYSALDQPVSILEPSPLLNFKKVMESGSRKSKGHRTVSLFLSEKLRRLRYGYEYGALEVKNHLEKVLFSDIVSTVMVLYSSHTSSRVNTCPWVCHFHLRKEILKRRRLKVLSVIDALNKECEANACLTNVQIMSKNGCLTNEGKEHDATICITATINECPKKPYTDLDTVRDVMIPSLLGAVVKGSVAVEKVDILWHDELADSRSRKYSEGGELYLSVSLSANCKTIKMWNLLVDECLPIMGLIDWTRSYPDDLSDMYLAYGIDVAWRSFLGNLNSAVNDVGKSILPEHLILVADCLSVTGEFVGLSAKGIARQKSHVSVSSPFLLACFTNPGISFIKAAKRGAADELQGSLDALAWGRIPHLGTGAQFEFVYSGKGHEIEKPVDPYSLLGNQTSPNEVDIKIKVPNGQKLISEKCGTYHFNGLSPPKVFKNLGIPKILLQKHLSVADIWRLSQMCKNILYKYPIDQRLSESDKIKLMTALQFHPRKKEKLGNGAVDIKVGCHSDYEDSRCFILERTDGTFEDFSYKKCVLGALQVIAPGRAKSYQARWSKNGSVQKA